MKANELRIGNYVNNCDERLIVDDIDDIDIFSKQLGEIPLHAIQPILLTQEWLIDFKFEVKSASVLRIHSFIKFGIVIQQTKFGEFFYKGTQLKYVHQLQNLYFALTGEELTLNENE